MEVSFNGGALWNLATIKIIEKPTRSGKYWCWIRWEYSISHEELALANEIVLRGWDEGHQTQPDKPTWNLMGMLNNPWFRVKIHKKEDPLTHSMTLTFEHPTLAGNQSGGWMPRMREHPALITPGVYVDPASNPITLEPELIPEIEEVVHYPLMSLLSIIIVLLII
jgi:nitrate reductase (NAD(P)H)